MTEAVYFAVLIIVLSIIQYNQYCIEKRLNSGILELKHILYKQIDTLTKEKQSRDMRSEILQKMMKNDENDGIYD